MTVTPPPDDPPPDDPPPDDPPPDDPPPDGELPDTGADLVTFGLFLLPALGRFWCYSLATGPHPVQKGSIHFSS